MRLRGLRLKIFAISAACGIFLFVCVNLLLKRESEDEFLTHLEALEDSESVVHKNTNSMDPKVLLNLTNFQYILPNDICDKYSKELLAIIIVVSYVGHDKERSAQRQAIAQSKLAEMGFQRVFLLADIPSHEKFITQKQLESEQQRFGDLVQGNFQDSYHNLSYKHIMGLRWSATTCPNAKFIVKLDDDIICDLFQVRRHLESLEVQRPSMAISSNLLSGFIIKNNGAIRAMASKWYVSTKEYANTSYPYYLSGWMYITNAPTALRLVEEAHKVPMFWIDDVWVTGTVRSRLNIPLMELNSWFAVNATYVDCCIRDLKEFSYECEFYVGPSDGNYKLMVDFLHNVEKCYFDECSKREPEKFLYKTCTQEKATSRLPLIGIPVVKSLRLR